MADNEPSELDERLGLDKRPTTLMGSITASSRAASSAGGVPSCQFSPFRL